MSIRKMMKLFKHVQVLNLGENDTLVVKVNGRIDPEMAAHIKARMSAILKGRNVLVHDEQISLSVLREDAVNIELRDRVLAEVTRLIETGSGGFRERWAKMFRESAA